MTANWLNGHLDGEAGHQEADTPAQAALRSWLTGTDAAAMIRRLGDRREWWLGRRHAGLDRPLRLWACACVRQSRDRLTSEVARHTVEVAEAAADCVDGTSALATALQESFAAMLTSPSDTYLTAAHGCTYEAGMLYRVSMQLEAGRPATTGLDWEWLTTRHADLARDIFGNPFGRQLVAPSTATEATPLGQLVVFDPAWANAAVRRLAGVAYASARPTCRYCNVPLGEAGRLPCCCREARDAAEFTLTPAAATDGVLDPEILAVLWDALEEAGCDVPEVRLHLTGRMPCPDCLGAGGVVEVHTNRWGTTPAAYRVRRECVACRGSGHVALRGPHVKGCWALDLARGLRGPLVPTAEVAT